MGEEDKAPVSFTQPSVMNFSNANFDRVSERVERSRDDPQVGISHLDANLKAAPPVKKPGNQMAAASALAGLKPSGATGQDYLPDDDPDCDFQIPLRFTKSGRRRATPFPMKVCIHPRTVIVCIVPCQHALTSPLSLQLMKVLSTRRFNDIICWTPDGTSFSIIRPKAFASEILPLYFKEAKYSSFTRKLHRWGFQRHLRGVDTGSFYHKNFQRGRLDLLDLMTCYKPREASARAAGKFPKSTSSGSSMLGGSQGQPPMMPPVDLIAEAQAIRARQQQAELMGMQTAMGEVSEERLNAAIELEVSRRLQQRVDAASSFSRLAMMQQGSPPPYEGMGMPPPGYPTAASSPGRLPPQGPRGLPPFEGDSLARLQQANALRLSRGYDDQRFPRGSIDEQQQQAPPQQQQYFDQNLDSMGRGA